MSEIKDRCPNCNSTLNYYTCMQCGVTYTQAEIDEDKKQHTYTVDKSMLEDTPPYLNESPEGSIGLLTADNVTLAPVHNHWINLEALPDMSIPALQKLSQAHEIIKDLIYYGVHEYIIEHMLRPIEEVLKHNGVNLNDIDI